MSCNQTKIFRFKHFSVSSGGNSFEVGTDGVLLGAWTHIPYGVVNILDIGTGSGLVAMMLAQRCPNCKTTGIDINAEAVKIANDNAANCCFASSIRFCCADVRSFECNCRYNLIVSNPPFFKPRKSGKNTTRSIARSFETLTPEQLISVSARLLEYGGHFAAIIPYDISEEFEFLAWEHDLFTVHATDVITVEGRMPKRKLLQFVKTDKSMDNVVRDTLVLQTPDGNRTPQYKLLTKDFYLDKQ